MQVIHAIGRNFDKEFVWPRPRSTTRVWWSDKRGILIDLNDVPLFHNFLQANLMVSSRFLRFSWSLSLWISSVSFWSWGFLVFFEFLIPVKTHAMQGSPAIKRAVMTPCLASYLIGAPGRGPGISDFAGHRHKVSSIPTVNRDLTRSRSDRGATDTLHIRSSAFEMSFRQRWTVEKLVMWAWTRRPFA